jgi:argininosuccinate lyase
MKAAEFNYARMQHAAQSGFMNAWAAATYLVQRGVPSRTAHEQVGRIVQKCVERGCEIQDVPLNELRSMNPVFDQDLYTHLTLDSVLAIHDVEGGTAPARVRQAITEAKLRIEAISEEAHAHP